MRRDNRVGSCEVEKSERLAVKEWHGSAELPKKRRTRRSASELARATPRSNPKSGDTKRRVFGVFCGTYDFGVFSAVPLPFIFCGKMEGEPSGDPSEDPHPHRQSKNRNAEGLAKCWRLRRARFD